MSVAISSLSVRVTLSNSALCATFKDKAKNGNLDLAALDHHVATDPLFYGHGVLVATPMATDV